MKIPRHFVDNAIKVLGWQPYIKEHFIDFGQHPRGGVIITFKGHEQHEYKCSYETAKEILDLAKGIVK